MAVMSDDHKSVITARSTTCHRCHCRGTEASVVTKVKAFDMHE